MSVQTSLNAFQEVITRNLVFVGGKGGVGKTAVSQAIALNHAERGKRTLWVTFEDPTRKPLGQLVQAGANLWHLNAEASVAFEEYAAIKIGTARLTKIFVQNKLMRYLSQAAPGIHELVLLGKVWFERTRYDHVVVDMPSTGYGLAMFQSTANFARLFGGGPIHRDAEDMLQTFRSTKDTGHLIVALPEEMPLVESLELGAYLKALFPENAPAYLINRRFPVILPEVRDNPGQIHELPHTWENPLASSALDYARKRNLLEAHNLKTWTAAGIGPGLSAPYAELPMVPPPSELSSKAQESLIASALARLLKNFALEKTA
jgi:hypothetical protein